MPQAWLVKIGFAIADALGLKDLAKTIALVLVALIVGALLSIFAVMLAPFALLGGGAGGAGPGAVPPSLGFWADGLLAQDAQSAGIPPVLALAVIDHESAGQWTAEHQNTNGSTDAGLMQVNSANWSRYGLAGNPYAPTANVRAGVTILAGDLASHPGDVSAALEAYDGGGLGYAQAVLADLTAIESGPHLAVAQLGGGALPAAGAGKQVVLVTAWASFGTATTAYGQSWPGLVAPDTLTATAAGSPVPLTPCAQASSTIKHLLPAGATCWVAVVATGQPVTVTATWHRTTTRTWTGPHGHAHTETIQEPVTASATAP